MNQKPNNSLLRALDALLEGRPGAWFINLVAIPAMLLLILILPPLALPQRVLSAGYTGIAPTRGGGVSVEDSSQFSIPANATKSNVNIKMTMQKRDAFLKSSLAKDLPITLEVKSAAYQPSLQGQTPALAILSLLLPEEIEPLETLDVYGWTGKKWVKLPAQIFLDEDRVEVYLTTFVPNAVVIGHTQPQAPTITTDVSAKSPLAASAAPLISEVTPVGLTIVDGGGIAGSVPESPATGANSPYNILPTVSNLEGARARADLVEAMLGDAKMRKEHIQALMDIAVEKLYPGLNIEYAGVSPELKKDFTIFIRDLAKALHAKDKTLAITLPMPTQRSQDAWDTGGYDWDALGLEADIVRIPAPVNRNAYGNESSEVASYLRWAVGRVDRYKLQLAFSMQSRDEFGNAFAPITFANASKLMGPVATQDKPQPGDKVTLELPKLRDGGGIKYDDASGVYFFGYKDDKGQQHTVVLENADSLAKKIALAQQFNLRGIALQDVSDDTVEPRAWNTLKQYRESQTVASKGTPVISWRADGKPIGMSPAGDPKFVWTAPNQPGDAQVDAALSLDNGRSSSGSTGTTNVQIARPPTPVPTRAPEVVAPRPTAAAAAPASAAPPSNFRGKNLFGYGVQVNGSDPTREAGEIKGLGFSWVKLQVVWKDYESSKGNVNWDPLDRFANTMAGSGINVLFSITKAPDWSRPINKQCKPGGCEGPPDNMQDAADFMGRVAARYCGKVKAIEVWNEPNLDVEWHDKRGVSAANYMDMLKRAYTEIKKVCPETVVVSGASTPTGGDGGNTAFDDHDFLRQLYNNPGASLKDWADAIGVHPSGYCSAPDALPPAPNICGRNPHRSEYFRATMESYYAVMVQYGDKDKQLWPTEFGWPVGTGGGAHPAGVNTSADQAAQWYKRAYELAKQWKFVGPMFAWQWDFGRSGEIGAFSIQGTKIEEILRTMPK